MNTGAEVAAELSKVISAEDIVLMQEIYELTPKDSVFFQRYHHQN